MYKTTSRQINSNDNLSTSTEGLMSKLGCGYATAVAIGKKAGARIKIGRRTLWNLQKVQSYLNEVSGDEPTSSNEG